MEVFDFDQLSLLNNPNLLRRLLSVVILIEVDQVVDMEVLVGCFYGCTPDWVNEVLEFWTAIFR